MLDGFKARRIVGLMSKTMTETQIKNAARKIARKAVRLQAQGKHEEAREMVDQAMRNVEAMRSRGEVA
jgi:uncharacterized protein YgbK (DUF1537 family)